MIGENLLRFNYEQKYLLFDGESCNLALADSENFAWEWAWQVCTLKDILEEREYLVKWPRIPISADAARITGFYLKQPRIATEGKSPEFVLDELEKHLYDPSIIPVAHNGLGFDVYLHNLHRRNLGRKPDYSYISRFLDTNAVARAWKLGMSFDNTNRLAVQYQAISRKQKGMKTSVKALCAEFGFEYDETRAHQAKYDCFLLRQILLKLINTVEI